jgi:alpha-glucosidase
MMVDPAWWRSAVVYQVYLRSFQDSDGDGVGDLEGLRRRLGWLADDLGVDVLWLSPIHPSPDIDFGYDVADYVGVHPVFGDLAAFDRLVEEATRRGLRIVLDGVFNHTSDQHDWFVQSRDKPGGPFGDFYIWRDGRRPNNWAGVFGGPAWRWVASRQQSYLHSFAPEQPDLNWRNPAVEDAVLDSMRFWFERGVAGFRLDVFNCCLKDPELRDNPRRWDPVGLVGGLVYGFIGQDHVHDRDHPDLARVLGRMRALADEHDAFLVGETLDERLRYDNAAQWVGDDRLHMAFHFRLLHSRWGAARFAQAIRAQIDALGPDRWPTWVFSNHDFARVASRWGGDDARVKLVALLATTLRGTPFLYNGDELGLREARLSRAQIQDPPGKRFWPLYRGRDGCRTPMQWDASPGAGFTHGAPWLPISDDFAARNVETMRADPDSVLSVWMRALAARKRHPVLQRGRQHGPLDHPHLLRFSRVLGEARADVVLNLTGRSRSVAVSPDTPAVWLGTHRDAAVVEGGRTLRPYEGVVLGAATPAAGG